MYVLLYSSANTPPGYVDTPSRDTILFPGGPPYLFGPLRNLRERSNLSKQLPAFN